MSATMPEREITLAQAAAAFLGALGRGYGDGQPNDWVSRGAPSERPTRR